MTQARPGEHVYQQQSDEMNCQLAHNRCAMATPDGGIDDELGQRPYRCHVCRVGFKLKVIMTSAKEVIMTLYSIGLAGWLVCYACRVHRESVM